MRRSLLLAVLLLPADRAAAQCEQQKLTTTNPSTWYFGFSVALSNDRAVIGTPYEDGSPHTEEGAVYAFDRTAAGWIEVARLTPNDSDTDGWFGHSVALSGNTLLVGSPRDGSFPIPGAAFVFEHDGLSWVQTAKLTPSDPTSWMLFGVSVALDGDRALVGANGNRTAYLFERTGSTWTEIAKLRSSDGQLGDEFGFSLALSGDLALVGAPSHDDGAGAAYFFDEAVGWTEAGKVVPSDPTPDKYFGLDVAMSGSTVVVGAPGDDTLALEAGAAYVFESQLGGWSQTAKLLPGDGRHFGFFGTSVAVSDEVILVGADSEGLGSAYQYVRGPSGWRHAARIHGHSEAEYDDFGISLDMEGETALVGAASADGPFGTLGAAYVFQITRFATAYCFGAGCPCGNDDPVSGGCANSMPGSDGAPHGALLAACGSGSVSTDDLVLTLSQLVPNQFGIFYMGGGELQLPFGDGLQCVGAGGQGIFRYSPPQSSGGAGVLTLGPGIVARSQSFAVNGHIDAGETWYFQGWYRDPMGPCGTAFNLSNALAITFAR